MRCLISFRRFTFWFLLPNMNYSAQIGAAMKCFADVKIKSSRKVKWRRRSRAQRPKSLTNTFTYEIRYVFECIRFHSLSFILSCRWHLSRWCVWRARRYVHRIHSFKRRKKKTHLSFGDTIKSNAMYEMYAMNAFGHRLRAAVWLDRCCHRWLLSWPFFCFSLSAIILLLFLLLARIARRRARSFYYLDARARIHYLEKNNMNFL